MEPLKKKNLLSTLSDNITNKKSCSAICAADSLKMTLELLFWTLYANLICKLIFKCFKKNVWLVNCEYSVALSCF